MTPDEAICRRVAAANNRFHDDHLGYALAWLFARREVVTHIGWRFTFGSWRGREFLLDTRGP